jgi:small subunit ribosomal protein S6
MTNYEVLYIVSPSISEEEREALIAKFKTFVESKAGTVAGIDKWGLKKLAYPIAFKSEGFYVLMNYAAEAEVSTAMESLMRITDGILRAIVVRK